MNSNYSKKNVPWLRLMESLRTNFYTSLRTPWVDGLKRQHLWMHRLIAPNSKRRHSHAGYLLLSFIFISIFLIFKNESQQEQPYSQGGWAAVQRCKPLGLHHYSNAFSLWRRLLRSEPFSLKGFHGNVSAVQAEKFTQQLDSQHSAPKSQFKSSCLELIQFNRVRLLKQLGQADPIILPQQSGHARFGNFWTVSSTLKIQFPRLLHWKNRIRSQRLQRGRLRRCFSFMLLLLKRQMTFDENAEVKLCSATEEWQEMCLLV